MEIATVADWATSLAFGLTLVGGAAWLWWKRRKRSQRLSAISGWLSEVFQNFEQVNQDLHQNYVDKDASPEERIIAQLGMIWVSSSVTNAYLYADIILTHQDPPLLPEVKLQWPIAPRYKQP